MAHGSYELKDQNPGPIRFYCPLCHRWAQQQRDALIERFGPDQGMPDLLMRLRPCGKPNTYSDRCKLIYWDCMSDAARLVALANGDMPDAWRDRMSPPWWNSIRELCEDLNRPAAPPEPHVSYYDRTNYRR